MTQYARPDADSVAGNWVNESGSGSNLYQSIDESTPSDSDYCISTDSFGSTDTMRVELSGVTDPTSASDHKVVYRAKGTDPSGFYGIPTLTVTLKQGSTTIATATNSSLSGSFTEYTITLSSAEANNITDYTDLLLEFQRGTNFAGGSETTSVSYAAFECPDAAVTDNTEFRVGDRVKETTTTTGTGTLDLDGAETGYQTFVAGVGDGNMTYYVIEEGGTTNWEVGIGKVTDAGTDTLTRATVIASTNSNSQLDLAAGTHNVFCASPSRMESTDVVTKTTTYTVTQSDSTVLCDTSGGAFTVTMPTAAEAYSGLKFLIKKITSDANVLTISSGATDFVTESGALSSTKKLFCYEDFIELQCIRRNTTGDYIWSTVNKGLRSHVAVVTQTTQQTISNETWTQVSFNEDTIEIGADADHANNKIVIKRAGTYLIGGYVKYVSLDASNTGAVVKVGITPDGGAISYWKMGGAANWSASSNEDKRPSPSTFFIKELAVDDVITLYTWQDDNSSEVTLVSSDEGRPYLQVQEIR